MCLEYSIPYTFHYGHKYITIRTRRSERIRRYISSQLQLGAKLVIPSIVQDEFRRKLWDVLSDVVSKARIPALPSQSLFIKGCEHFEKLKSKCLEFTPEESLIKKVNEFYRKIWADPSLQKKREVWSKIKKKDINEGPPTGADIIILATALAFSDEEVELLTLDSDFIIFKDEIEGELRVYVRDADTV